MALQVTRIFVNTPSDDPVEGADVAFVDTVTGVAFFAVTGVDGKAELSLEEATYAVSVRKRDHISPAPITIEVATLPIATSAVFNPPSQANPSLIDGALRNLNILIDESVNTLPFPVDLFSAGVVTVSDIVDAINDAANTNYGATYNSVASEISGEVRLTSPTVGVDSDITVFNVVGDPTASAVGVVFGLVVAAGNEEVTGAEVPSDHNDFDMVLTPRVTLASADPDRCTLSGFMFTNQPGVPIKGARMIVEVLVSPRSTDDGSDIGESFYVEIEEDGLAVFETMRNVVVRISLLWQDRSYSFTVPDASSVDLADFITPYVKSLELNPSSVASLVVGEELEFGVEATFSDSRLGQIEDGETIFSSSDSDVATFLGNALTALQVGSTTVQVSNKNRRNQIILSDPVAVTVT